MDLPSELSPLCRTTLALIEDDAREGKPARTNLALADALNSSNADIARALNALRQAGLVELQTNGHGVRRFRACRLGLWTKCSSRKNAIAVTRRPCISCRVPFPSAGAHNRMCRACVEFGPPDPLGPARGDGLRRRLLLEAQP